MGKRNYPPLTPGEVVAILRSLGFTFKNQVGSHAQFERSADTRRPRSVVSVDMHYKEFDQQLIKMIIRQSNHNREEFYGATKQTARRAAVPFLHKPEVPGTDPHGGIESSE